MRTARFNFRQSAVKNSSAGIDRAPLIIQYMDIKLAPRGLGNEEEDPAIGIERLVGLFTSGHVESARCA
jgi:hypothetical protein